MSVAGRLLTFQHSMTIPTPKSFISSLVLQEISRFKKETGKKPVSWKDKFAQYAKEGKNTGNLFVHFSNYPKMGLYLQNHYRTPIGFYAYLLHPNKIEEFAVDRAYAIIFRAKPGIKILSNSLTEEELKEDVAKLIRMFGHYAKEVAANVPISAWYDQYVATKGRWFSFLWSVTRTLSGAGASGYSYKHGDKAGRGGGPTGKWTYLLWKILGYDGVVDDGHGIIHHAEPAQAVFFNTTQLEIVEILHLQEDGSRSTIDLLLGTHDFSNQDLRKGLPNQVKKRRYYNANFSNSDLSGAPIGNLFFSGAIFTNANLKGTNFVGLTARNSVFVGANAENADFSNADLYRSKFVKTKLVGVNFTNANLYDCSFNGANLRGVNLSAVRNVAGANFADADLRGANLRSPLFAAVGSLKGAKYDSNTKFPKEINPEKRGMIKVD